jgi:hypothetical protein
MYKKFALLSFFMFAKVMAESHEEIPIQYSRVCPYGTFSLSSGAGISWRSRTDCSGRSIDMKAGVGEIPGFFGSRTQFKSLSCDYNWVRYFGKKEDAFYLSCGLGAALVADEDWKMVPLPLVPLRAGYQFRYGFVDVGAKVFVWMPIPELRAGISFEF